MVPQGGNTGLVGASVPRGGEVVISLGRLSQIGDVDTAVGQVTVGAGATLAALQQAARDADEDAALDFGARDSCTVGGVVACDAGGARALRHGTARAHVAGLEAVLADGSVISRLAGLRKDNAGYNLPALLVGSEGTLGIITRVRWKLAPLLAARVAALVPLGSAREAAGCWRRCGLPRHLWKAATSFSTRASAWCSSTSGASRRCAPEPRSTCWPSARRGRTRPRSSPRRWSRRASMTR